MSRAVMDPITVTTEPQTMDSSSPGTGYANLGAAGQTCIDTGTWGEFVAFATVHQNPTGTNPTLDIRIQQSPDTVEWTTLGDFTQFTTSAGTNTFSVPGPGTSYPKTFARYIRFMGKVSGTTPVYTATIHVSMKE